MFILPIIYRWDDDKADCFANICDAEFRYWHEYLGNTARLVITPLTDRCYITLTQVNIHFEQKLIPFRMFAIRV